MWWCTFAIHIATYKLTDFKVGSQRVRVMYLYRYHCPCMVSVSANLNAKGIQLTIPSLLLRVHVAENKKQCMVEYLVPLIVLTANLITKMSLLFLLPANVSVLLTVHIYLIGSMLQIGYGWSTLILNLPHIRRCLWVKMCSHFTTTYTSIVACFKWINAVCILYLALNHNRLWSEYN